MIADLTAVLAKRACAALVPALASVSLGYPSAYVSAHGLKASGWPPSFLDPPAWFECLATFDGRSVADAYVAMAIGVHPAFADGGSWEAAALFASGWAASYLLAARSTPGVNAIRAAIDNLWAVIAILSALSLAGS